MRQTSLLIIFFIVFLDLVGFGIVIPILPYYAQDYGASGWAIGWLMASYSLMQFLFSPFWGRISDHIGRRPVLLISIVGQALGMAILAVAGSLEWLFIGRILAGIFAANISTAYAYVTDVTQESDRAKGMGLIGAGFGLGFIFGPAIGGVLSRYGYAVPMAAGCFLGIGNFIFAYFRLEEPRLSKQTRSAHRFKRFSLTSLRLGFASAAARYAVAQFFLLTLAVTQMEVTFAIYLGARYGYDAENAGVLLAIMGTVMVIVQGGLIGRLARRFGEARLVGIGASIAAFGLALFASTNSIAIVVISLVILAFGHGMLHPSLSSIASMGADESNRGSTMGVFQSAGSLARITGPPIAGWLYDHVSWRSPYYCGSILLAVVAAAGWTWYRLRLGAGPAAAAESV